MNQETPPVRPSSPATAPGGSSLGSSSIFRLCEEVIALRENTNRQLKLFEQSLSRQRDAFQSAFNTFAAQTQQAYQQMRQELHGEKRLSLTLMNELLDVAIELSRIVAARPNSDDTAAFSRWADAVEVEARRVQDFVRKHGIEPYDAVVGSSYNPALHERVGTRRMEGMDAYRVAEQREPGYASQQPEFVLRRPKVVISE